MIGSQSFAGHQFSGIGGAGCRSSRGGCGSEALRDGSLDAVAGCGAAKPDYDQGGVEAVITDSDYAELLVAHQPAKPRNRQELAEMSELLESLSANETAQTPAMERFIETLTALILRYEEELDPGPEGSPSGVLQFLMEERGLRQVDLVAILGSKSYVSQILSGHRPISRKAAVKLAEFFWVSAHSFL